MCAEPNNTLADHDAGNEVSNTLPINYYQVKKAALVLRSINHKLRQQIIKIINENNKLTVTEIYVKLMLEQSVASQHLAILRKAGIVSTKRESKFIYYTINKKRIAAIEDFVSKLVG
ncbi:MAG: helix-turn-helix transcriptional regulator [Chitinophagaceae bacterium]|nr:helix-turn-helix transcriptional regulator [Chitinophagaceae bacterium]